MDALTVYFAFAMAHVTRLKNEIKQDGDRGDIVQTVIIIAAFAGAAIIITAILITKAKDTANNVKTQ